ncbi:MAG: efflux RND transporter permease subunit [Candidatus Sumerlaeaceae bacterium]|nr:efflux RND transporter permease subunit [Candidatus Sumerlaeaceae bacterium]
MLKHLIALSLRSPGLVLAAALLILGATVWRIPSMTVDVFPELDAPTVVIMTEAGGLAADEVEQFVTMPLESAVNGLPGVRRVRSASALGLSFVWVEFNWGEDIFRARQLVSERIATARENLPPNAHAELAPVSSITGEIMLISLTAPGGEVSPLELRALAEFDIRNRLLAVPGISQVVAIGGELPEYQVNLRQDRLLLYGLTATEVAEAAGEAHSVASAGYLSHVEGRELPIRQSGRIRSAADIANTIVKYHHGSPLTIGQVADVAVAGAPKRGSAGEGGQNAVVISIQKAPGTNTLRLTGELDKALDEIERMLPPGARMNRHVMRQADFISLSVRNVIHVSRDAAVLVAIVLILFLMNVRTTIITLTALPLSIAVALLLFPVLGLTVNVMTLGGLAVAIGELVDDAIIDVENVYRRLRENAALPPDERVGALQVVFNASNEIRSSVVFATVIIIIVFVPLLFLQGLEGRFFRPLGIAYITAILASLVVALTVTPAMCYLLLRKTGAGREHRDSWLVCRLKALYRPALGWALRWRRSLLGVTAAATLASLALGWTYGSSFLPEINEGTITLFLMAPPGTSLRESERLAVGVERHVATLPGVRHVVRRTGRAERDLHAEPVSFTEIDLGVAEGVRKEDIRQALKTATAGIPGITTMIGQPIEHRLSHILSGTPAAIAIDIYGHDLDALRAAARDVERELKTLPGARDVAANREVMIDSVPVVFRAADLAQWGLTPAEAAGQIELAFSGRVVAEVNEGIRRMQVAVRLAPEERESIAHLRNFILHARGGAKVRLGDVATIGVEQTSNLIARENGRRKATVSCNVAAGSNLGDLLREVRAKVDPVLAGRGFSVHYGGQFEAQQAAARTISAMGVGVIVLILLLLRAALGSMRAALVVMVNLPLALIGGIVAIFIAESPGLVANLAGLAGLGPYTAPVVSVASMVGFITLFGIAVRNGILLVNHYHYLMRHEGRTLAEAVVQGSMERLVPILMTALTAILGLLPLVRAAGEPGGELLAPLAVVVLGGLVTSTALNLFIVPPAYFLFFRGRVGQPESLKEDDTM